MKFTDKTIPCVIIDDENDIFTYKGLIDEYTQEVIEFENTVLFSKIQQDYDDFHFKDNYFNQFIDLEFFKYKVVKTFDSYADLEKSFLEENKEEGDDESYIFLIDYKFTEVNETTTGIYILNFLASKNKFKDSRFIMVTSVKPDYEFVFKIKNAGFDGIIFKRGTIKSWEIGSFLNRVWRNAYFEFETRAYQAFTESFQIEETKLSRDDINFINDMITKDMYELAPIYFKSDEVLSKVKNFKTLKKTSQEYNRLKNLRYNKMLVIAKKLACKANRDSIIKAGFKYLNSETLRHLIKEGYNFKNETHSLSESTKKE